MPMLLVYHRIARNDALQLKELKKIVKNHVLIVAKIETNLCTTKNKGKIAIGWQERRS